MPEKGSCRSQYVVRKRAQQEKEEKAERKAKSKKKFINMALNTKKFNGVVVGSDNVILNKKDDVQKDSSSNIGQMNLQLDEAQDEQLRLNSENNLGQDNYNNNQIAATNESWHTSAIK